MKKRKYELFTTNCKRCNKPITTSTRSLFGADRAHAKFAEICAACMTPEENAEMQQNINAAVFANGGRHVKS